MRRDLNVLVHVAIKRLIEKTNSGTTRQSMAIDSLNNLLSFRSFTTEPFYTQTLVTNVDTADALA